VIKTLFLLGFLALNALAADPGFTALFDGKTLNGWRYVGPKSDSYFVEKGLLVTASNARGNLFTEAEYANFVFRFDFKLTEGANNGIGIRAPFEGDAAYQGMEIQILDHDADMYKGKLRPAQYHGSIYDVFPAKTGYLKRTEWNHEEISANGSRIMVTLNGTVIVDADLSTVTDPEVLKKHPGLKRASGHIGLLGHDSRVEFRNLQIKKL
jgi:3-keto-disaccharide hydrolase